MRRIGRRLDLTGWSVAFPVDLDDDGLDDVLVGAPENDASGLHDGGQGALSSLGCVRHTTDAASVARNLQLHDRELGDADDVEALVTDVRKRLLDQLRPGVRIRLVPARRLRAGA